LQQQVALLNAEKAALKQQVLAASLQAADELAAPSPLFVPFGSEALRPWSGMLRVCSEQDLMRDNAHLSLDGPCPFECRCCVM